MWEVNKAKIKDNNFNQNKMQLNRENSSQLIQGGLVHIYTISTCLKIA